MVSEHLAPAFINGMPWARVLLDLQAAEDCTCPRTHPIVPVRCCIDMGAGFGHIQRMQAIL